MKPNLKKGQEKIKKDFESSINTIVSNDNKQFSKLNKQIEGQLKTFYEENNLSPDTIQLLRQNPSFALGVKNLTGQTNEQIKALFKNYQETLPTHLQNAYNVGFSSRIWEAEISQSIIYEIERQPLPFVEELLMNKEQFGFTLADRVTNVSATTQKALADYLESSLMSGASFQETKQGVRDIIGYTVEGKRQKGALARANKITRTELRRSYNTAQNYANDELESLGVESTQVWVATLDRRTRVWHLSADHQVKGSAIPNKFIVGGEECDYPQDASLSARNSINCRCYIEYTTEPDQKTLRAVRDKEKLPNGRRALPKNLEDASWKKWRATRLSELGVETKGF